MKKLFAVLSVIALATSLTACNTFRGLGQDVERGGEKMQNSADQNQKK